MYIFLQDNFLYLTIAYIVVYLICLISIGFLIKKNKEIHNEYKALKEVRDEVQQEVDKNKKDLDELNKQQSKLIIEIADATTARQSAIERAQEAEEVTKKLLSSQQERLAAEQKHIQELGEIKIQQEYDKLRSALKLQYDRENADLIRQKVNIETEIDEITNKLKEFRSIRKSINEAILREKELQEKEDFYSILVSENDKEDIQILQSMDLKLHNRDVIPKLVWELYIRRPCQEMIKRVTGNKKLGGIYKITYKKTGEAYIGKTVDFSTRWQNHCKTAIGLDGCAKATLHTRMAADGLWNYTFEILEVVDKDQQSEKEAFYIDIYGTKNQLNMKEGNKIGTQ